MGKLPPGVALVVATLKVDPPEPVSDAGFRLGVTPTGWPRTVTARFTVAANPFNELSVMVLVPVLPCVTSIVPGDGVNEKFGPVYTGQYRSEEHTSELQSPCNLVCRLLLVKNVVILGGDGAEDGLQMVRLLCPQDAVISPELIEDPPGFASRDDVFSHDGAVGHQAQQAHLGDPAQDEVIGLLIEPLPGDVVPGVPAPGRGEPDADVHQYHWLYRSMSSASKEASMSALVTSTRGPSSRPISGKVSRPAGRPRPGLLTSCAMARVKRSLRDSPRCAALTLAARIRSGGRSSVVRIFAY